MGVSANQARLMTLTARQHDLELRAQSISALKMVKSLESQAMATEYSNALNNYSKAKQAAAGDSSVTFSLSYLNTDGTTATAEDAEGLLAGAKARYDAETAKISAEEKMLDMELTQINTEHTAIKTEYDAVKSLIGDNVEKSFNVFG